MTYSIFPSFNYIRPIFFIDGRTSTGQPCKDRYQGGIENTDRTLAILEPSKTVAKVATWQVVLADRSAVVECHNLASARAYASGRAPNKVDEPTSYTYPATPYQAPSGQFYVMIHTSSRDIRMDVANVGTARHYAKHGVDTGIAGSAYLSSFSQ
tara:strand:+ start:593 stop:1054 length:462 start_codon:yes stop_codon:yes gene_type:complete